MQPNDPIPISSAYEAELFAQLIAHAMTAANAWARVCICFDAIAPADVVAGEAAGHQDSQLRNAAVAWRMCCLVRGAAPLLQHVKSHTGSPGNELADSLATHYLHQPHCTVQPWQEVYHAVMAQEYDWLWLLGADKCSPMWPKITDAGLTAQVRQVMPSPQLTSPACWTRPREDTVGRGKTFKCSLCTYNTLSARTALQKRCLHAFLNKHSLDVLFLQETREKAEPMKTVDGVYRFASTRANGQEGCQIWVNTRRTSHLWNTKAFAIVHSEPRVLVIRAVLGGQPLLLVSAHALTSVAEDHDIHHWWKNLDAALCSAPRGHLPLLGVDANAHWEAGIPAKKNAHEMHKFMRKWELCSSGQHDARGRPLATWISPTGQPKCLDYIMIPMAFEGALHVMGCVPILDQHSGVDHCPLQCRVQIQKVMACNSSVKHIDVEKMHTPAGKKMVHTILQSAPQPTWDTDVDSHLACLHHHIQQGLERHFCADQRRPRKPVLSDGTWAL